MLLQNGSTGDEVKDLQQRLISLGYSVGVYGADGSFGQGTYDAVVKFQSDHGLSVDGIVGPDTFRSINGAAGIELLRIGSIGERVAGIQQNLINKGYSVGVYGADGSFGQGTYDAVVKFQGDHGLSADGIVGPATWNALNGYSGWDSSVSGSDGVNKFIEVAKRELEKGFKEHLLSNGEGDNINPYGEWYGMNGEPWCAMFVSWCANKAGILGSVVPRYSYCETGANWYKSRGRYRTRFSNYIPKPGDVIFFTKASGFYYHTGIVIEYNSSNNIITTIEGNAGQAVSKRYYTLNHSDINGYGAND
ncbi:peptidoglycan-binding protein [Clostridium frigidicarnis]|uniref:Peptidoglycan-binding (PGRP) domain of peptidoglycan hydrolases-containing protein n=1 Tax=Clostridium frigidicarnis TaxID=84698 RepID=A0A1I1ANV2_9CLOT|nr:peptidoglycan-binding protein [Clostridium frigidicarnis]SFB38013.1 Peptidoglycan-binding (PGRP) domain of peptidoglycan hydrolases-containing protein [Clostridium frigidicarnis]